MDEKNAILGNDLPWLIFSLNGFTYAINSEFVTGILVPPDNFTPVPNAPAEYRGIANIRGEVYHVIDMRCLFGYDSLDKECADFTKMIETREQDHLNWANELKRSVENNTEFTLTTDPHKCAFGIWYDKFKSNPHNADYSLHKIEKPHEELHRTAEKIAEIRKRPDSPEKTRKLSELMNMVFDEYVPEIVNIMDEAKRRYTSFFRETMVTFNSEAGNAAIVVDKVLAVDRITHVSGKSNMDRIFASPYFIGVARNSRVDDDILVIDVKKIIAKTGKDIPNET
ncbi:MAG: chemotaxis protein CheW [Oscillospiraceae bacterium]